MAKKAPNLKSLSQNIHILLQKLNERELVPQLQKEFSSKKNGDGYREILKLYAKYLDLSYKQLPDDSTLAKKVAGVIEDFDSKRKYFYAKLVAFAGEHVEKHEPWYSDCLTILHEVDALWNLELKDQAEMRFMDIYDSIPENHSFQREYHYVISRIAYYHTYFLAHSYLNKKEVHEQFLNKTFSVALDQIEKVFVYTRALDKSPMENVQGQELSGALEFYNLLAETFKRSEHYKEEITAIREAQQTLLARNLKTPPVFNDMSIMFKEASSYKFPFEYIYAQYFLLRTREYYLLLKQKEFYEAQEVLKHLYNNLAKVSGNTEHYFVGFYYFISTELYRMKLDLYYFDSRPENLDEPQFEFYQKQVENLPLRHEVNSLIYAFLKNNGSYAKLIKTVQEIREVNSKAADISFELNMIEALMQFHMGEPSEAMDRITGAKRDAKKNGLSENDFFITFCSFFNKLNKLSNMVSSSELFQETYIKLKEIRTLEHPIFNLIMYWMERRLSEDFLEKLEKQEIFKNPGRHKGLVKSTEGKDGKDILYTEGPVRRYLQ